MAQETHSYIRNVLEGMFDADTAQAVRIQYGGSMKPDNAEELVAQEDIDGGLIGGASLKAEDFSQLIKNAKA
jgi:triosephosphate isomerase